MNPTNTNTPTFYKGDTVRIKDNYFNSGKRGKQGTVLSTGVRNAFLSGLVSVKLDSGEEITLTEISLELVEDSPVEGEVIDRKYIKVGQTIRVTFSTVIGSYTQTSTKEGVVTRVRTGEFGGEPTPIVQPEASEITLSFGSSREVYTLVKDAPEVDEIAEALKELKDGSIVQFNDGNQKITFTKTQASQGGEALWNYHQSRYNYSELKRENFVRSKMTDLKQIVVKH